MTQDRITVETRVHAPIATVWRAYTSPDDIRQWNFASPDWHCPAAQVDLREGGAFSSRMEAKDGSMGFDFAGTYTKVVQNERLEYAFGDRQAVVEFHEDGDAVRVRVTFDPDGEYPRDMQASGWQAILENFARHAEDQ
ncbi:SRPBCC family protein [Achromobacter sp. GG226]|uniref:SRPBCC family protein n=1 Tax=Verticiella alkaliphila TaxID=2779529 RepID=UPI001C0D9401|nr:SRPBCC family protein [Verticiella sp. GG226]MBU4609776.1 SRPBCC family protein [Verticiella sp. GG226]